MTYNYENEKIRTKIVEAVGEASMCWSETPEGVFNSTNAIIIAEKLYTQVQLAVNREVLKIKLKNLNKFEESV